MFRNALEEHFCLERIVGIRRFCCDKVAVIQFRVQTIDCGIKCGKLRPQLIAVRLRKSRVKGCECLPATNGIADLDMNIRWLRSPEVERQGFGRSPVGRPACVADADSTGERIACEPRFEVRNLPSTRRRAS
jgi:hypothetical protein